MTRKIIPLLLSSLLLTYGCKKETSDVKTESKQQISGNDDYHLFAKSFAKIIDNQEIKLLLKEKALEQFDGDYDVLVKTFVNSRLANNQTILDLLIDDNSNIKTIIDNNPLLTIYVPELQIFNANNWDVKKTTPIVAVRNTDSNSEDVIAYDNANSIVTLQKKIEPTIPTILIKENERVSFINSNTVQLTTEKIKSKTSAISSSRGEGSWRSVPPLAPRIQEAINKNIPLSNIRDYVYYGIDPINNVTKGELRSDYSEHIISIELTDKMVLDKIADWGEGNLEIKIMINIPQRNGSPLQITKAIFCKKEDLYQAPTARTPGYMKPYRGFEPIPITPWDNYNLGNIWTFHAEEFDNGEERTDTKTVENSFATENSGSFAIEFAKIFKLGFSAKNTETTKVTSTVTIKSTNNSDNLYDALLNYLEPIAIKDTQPVRGSFIYNPFYLNTGAIKIRVEPYPTGGIPST
ncbi:hypothetical protein [Sphingobacterium kitahiroshimense]|uniref:Uncharacterized protein n=1 Tax=Sphingobacterium kitahiroshimense TaxID=470446 RepID=A0ABV0C2Z0_9SPHI